MSNGSGTGSSDQDSPGLSLRWAGLLLILLLLVVVMQQLLLLLLQLSGRHANISVTWRRDRRPSCSSGHDSSRNSVHGSLHHFLVVMMRKAVGHGRALGSSIGQRRRLLLVLLETLARGRGVSHRNHLLRRRPGQHTRLMQIRLLVSHRRRWRRRCCSYRRHCRRCRRRQSTASCSRPWGHETPSFPFKTAATPVAAMRGDELAASCTPRCQSARLTAVKR